MQKISILFSLLGTLGFAADTVQSTPKIKGVLLVDHSSKVRDDGLDQVEGIRFDGIDNPGLASELTPFLSSLPMTADGAKTLCEAIAVHFRESEDLRVAVTMPEQNTSEGVVQLVVTPERIGELNIKNNQYTETETLTKWVRLSISDPINEKTMAQDLGWINTNPFRSVKVDYQPGERPGVTNVDLVVSDKKSWKISSGVDNTGTNPIGPIRIFGKMEVNDFIFTDHTLNFQGTTADHYNEYQGYTLNYTAPLPWRNTVKIFGSYTATAPHRANFPQKHRESFQASGRYSIPQWFGSNPWIDQLTFDAGFDFKGTNTNTLFEDDATPVAKLLAFVGQFTSSVNVSRNRPGNKLSAGVDLVGSPGRMMPHQTDADFNNLRADATPTYLYSRFVVAADEKLSDTWSLFVQGRAQFSLSNLIPSEQFALGGYSTVRGYDERVVNGDNAVCGNLEIRSQTFPVIGIWAPKVGDSLSFLGFVDTGYAWFREEVSDAPMSQSLLGFGPGLRYAVSSYFTSRLDVGFPLMKVEKDTSRPHVHFNAILSY